MKRIYVAEWVARIKTIPEHKDFDPIRDVVYATSKHSTFEAARDAALMNEGDFGYATVYTILVRNPGWHQEISRESVL